MTQPSTLNSGLPLTLPFEVNGPSPIWKTGTCGSSFTTRVAISLVRSPSAFRPDFEVVVKVIFWPGLSTSNIEIPIMKLHPSPSA